MAISPFNARPASPETERRRARLVVAIALVGIVATLLAYVISPSVRHAVGHAAHGVKGAVGHVFDHDRHHKHKHVAKLGVRAPAKQFGSSTAKAQAKAHGHTRTGSTADSKQPTDP